jgi:hypothetical protein
MLYSYLHGYAYIGYMLKVVEVTFMFMRRIAERLA